MIRNSIYKITLKERFLVFLEKSLDILLKIPAFQRYVNRKATNKYGIEFVASDGSGAIDDVFKDYHFDDIRKTDRVMDIGANVGAFSLFVSRFTKMVYAIEPMTHEILEKNIKLNHRNNISVWIRALGNGEVKLKWVGCKDRTDKGTRLWQLIELCDGHIDFLKIDCEGGEWSIEPWELKGIRRIEAEVHNFDGTHNLEDFLLMLDRANFEYTYTCPRDGILIVHARNRIL